MRDSTILIRLDGGGGDDGWMDGGEKRRGEQEIVTGCPNRVLLGYGPHTV